MSIESDLFNRLCNFNQLAALVGTRVYPLHAKQSDTLPFVVYQRISTKYVSAMGADRSDTSARFQFDCFGTTFDEAKAVALQVRLALQRYQSSEVAGLLLSEEQDEILTEDSQAALLLEGDQGIIDAFVLNENDFFEDAPLLYRSQIDFRIHFLT